MRQNNFKKVLKNPIFRLVPVLLFTLAAYYIWEKQADIIQASVREKGAEKSALLGNDAKEIKIEAKNTFNKVSFSLQSLKGKPLFLHFWATWCGPCINELPELIALSQKIQPLGFQFIAIALDKDWNTVESFYARNPSLRAMQNTMTILLDPQNTVASEYAISGVPETFLINRSFLVDNKLVGPQNWTAAEMKVYWENLIQ